MKYIRIAGASLNQIPLDIKGNTTRILEAIQESRSRGVNILCLPELAISGYGCEDAFFSDFLLESSKKALGEIISHTAGITVSVGLPLMFENCLYNVVAVIHDQQLLGFSAKQELPGDGIYYEPRWFKPWQDEWITPYQWEDTEVPIGDLVYEIGGVRIGIEICEDAWNGIRPAQDHYRHNVDLIMNPSASNFAFHKSRIREGLVKEASRAFNCTYLYTNLLGNEAGRIIYDGEILIAQAGELLARNQRFSFAEYEVLSAVVDIEWVHIQRKKSFNFRPELPQRIVRVPYSYPAVEAPTQAYSIAPYETKEEELYLAESLALFDYMRKSRSRGFVLSLSGGADSSACAVLAAHAIRRAERELGREVLLEKLAYAKLDPECDLVSQLLTCVYQGTKNSGDATLESARELSRGLGASFMNWEVEAIHQQYIDIVETHLGRALTWQQDDLALQNIQARLRSPGIWMLANIHRALLLTTSNRSEAAVGYATMDGDTSGGLAPLGGVDKNTLLFWLQWAETELNIVELSYVNQLQPTAELRPPSYDQRDEDDLMPYDVLDAIEGCAIRDYKSPLEVYLTLRGRYPKTNLKRHIRKFFTLWARNQWKRERYAPSFHLDDKNLDPKTWCRFPILNGGYWEALAEMDAYTDSAKIVESQVK